MRRPTWPAISSGQRGIAGFIGWLITLVNGQLPASMHLAFAAIIRYQTRTNCYYYLLTPTYPGGLFGDGPAYPAQGYGVPGADVPGYGVPGYGVPGSYGAAEGPWQPPGGGTAAGDFPATGNWAPADWRLLLTVGAKRLLGWLVGIGVTFWLVPVIVIPLVIVLAGTTLVTTQNAINTMNTANQNLTAATATWQDQQHACTTLTCFRRVDATAAAKFSAFASTVRDTPMPSGARAAADRLYSDATTIAQDISQLSKASSVQSYNSQLSSMNLQQHLDQMDRDNNTLGAALTSAR